MTVSSVYSNSESQFITVGVQFGSLASSIISVKVIFCNVPEKVQEYIRLQLMNITIFCIFYTYLNTSFLHDESDSSCKHFKPVNHQSSFCSVFRCVFCFHVFAECHSHRLN